MMRWRHSVVSYANDIRPLFTDEDVEHMLDVNPDLDLSSYDAVKANAQDIYGVLSSGDMPPGDPWPEENVAKFKQWMDENYPR
jgi:tyrosinase